MTFFSIVMIGLSILVFIIAIILNDYEIMNGALLPFAENVLAIFSVVFLVIGIFVAIFKIGCGEKFRRAAIILRPGLRDSLEVAKNFKGGLSHADTLLQES